MTRRGARLAAVALLAGVLVRAAPGAAADAPGDAPATAAALMELLAARRASHVSFTEVHRLAIMKQPLKSSGELFYRAPDWLEKRTLQPHAEDLVLSGGTLTLHRGRHSRVLELAQYPQVAPWVESIRATLAGDRGALERYFQVTVSGTLAHWNLLLVPADTAQESTIGEIRIAGAAADLQRIEIHQRDGDLSVMTIGPEIAP